MSAIAAPLRPGPPELRVERLAPRHAAGLGQLLGTNGFGCYCRYWHFAGNHREWLARCAHEPEQNLHELSAAVTAGSEEATGMVALAGAAAGGEAEVVGWLKLAPAARVSKLYEQRLYKGLPIFARDPAGVWAVSCLFVREDQRRRGIARALLHGAIEAAPALGARSLEAFPRSDTDVADAALMMGPLALFVAAGFEVVHDFTPYPVLRLALGAGAAP